MMIVPDGVKVHLAVELIDMRKGMDGFAMLVQDTLKKDPFTGHSSPSVAEGGDDQDPVLGRGTASVCSSSGSIVSTLCGRDSAPPTAPRRSLRRSSRC
jgi:hypothetical protein